MIGATFVIRAIILVDDYGILDIDHSSMLEDDTGNEACARLRPSLYPHSVLSARKRNSRNSHVSHSSFLEMLSQTSNAVSIPNKRKLYSVFAVMKVLYAKAIKQKMYVYSYLIPWPGPQAMFSIHKLVVPGPIEMQSSPVAILEFIIVTSDDEAT